MSTNHLTGKLVRLAPIKSKEDGAAIARWFQDIEYQWLSDVGPSSLYNPKQVQDFLEKESADMVFFSIRTVAEDLIIGSIDLAGIDWTAHSAWVGIGIGEREYWSRGFGTEAMQLVLRFAFEELNLKRVNLTVFEFNERAYRSYLKCGFKEEGRERQFLLRDERRWDLIHMGILQEEWQVLDPK